MKCQFNDGLKVDYSGSLRITKGDEVNVFMKEEFIPNDIRSSLDSAAQSNNNDEMRRVCEQVIQKVGSKACVHE